MESSSTSSIPSLPSMSISEEITARRSVGDNILSNLKDLKDAIGNRGEAFVLFQKNLLFLKGFGIFFLVTMSVINWYMNHKSYGFVSNNPTKFGLESGLFGLCGVLPFLLLVFLRNEEMTTNKIIFLSISIFVLFFGLNYALEISGFIWLYFNITRMKKKRKT